MTAGPRWTGCGLTDRGRVRASNQDAYLVANEEQCWAVADGMGGHPGGDVASRLAIESFTRAVRTRDRTDSAREAWLTRSICSANRAIWEEARRRPELLTMGTTLVTVMIVGDEAVIGHVGDSRAYRYRDGAMTALTRDHNVPGRPHVLSRSVGPSPDVVPDIATHRLRPTDLLLLCTDGLTKMLSDDAIAARLGGSATPELRCRGLVEAANAGGGADNVTVVLITRIDNRDEP